MIKEPYVSVKELIVNYPSVADISGDSILAGAIIAPCGPDNSMVNGPRDFLQKYTVDGRIPRNADVTLINAYYCSFFAPMLIKRAWAGDTTAPIINAKVDGTTVAESAELSSLPNSVVKSEYNIAWKFPIDIIGSTPVNNWKVGVCSAAKWDSDFADEFNAQKFSFDSGESIKYELVVVYWYDENLGKDSDSAGYRLVSLLPDGINPLTERPIYALDIINDDDTIPFVIDTTGINYSNTLSNTIAIEVKSEGSIVTTAYNNSSSINPANVTSALKWFDDNSDVYNIDYISDFGYTNAGTANELATLANKNKWFFFCDVAKSDTAINTIKTNYKLGENYRVEVVGPFDKSSAVTSWYADIAASSLILRRLYTNKASNSEFAPLFDMTNGTLNYQKPYKEFTKTQREELLSATYPINWVKFDRTNNVYYMNDNRTQTRMQNPMNEEMNVRMVNRLQRDIALLVPRYKGQLNNSKTRKDCEDLIKSYFDRGIMTQNYRPVEYQVICDTTNNTDAVINANKLAITVNVRLQGSIKYIEIINKVFPLGVDFSEE